MLDKLVEFVTVRSATAGLLWIALLVLSACNGDSYSGPPAPEDAPSFLVPNEYRPDTGRRRSNAREIHSREFGFDLSANELGGIIQGFEADQFGWQQDLYVIVSVYIPSIHDSYNPPEWVAKNREDTWYMRGNMIYACVAEELDPVTGFYRYYTFCDPDPSSRSNFFLMDRHPNENEPPPKTNDYIKGVCQDVAPTIRMGTYRNNIPDDVAEHIGCIFSGYTDKKDRFRYRLRGKNIALKLEVDNYIRQLLQGWRLEKQNSETS